MREYTVKSSPTHCNKECGEPTCLAYAVKFVNRQATKACPTLVEICRSRENSSLIECNACMARFICLTEI